MTQFSVDTGQFSTIVINEEMWLPTKDLLTGKMSWNRHPDHSIASEEVVALFTEMRSILGDSQFTKAGMIGDSIWGGQARSYISHTIRLGMGYTSVTIEALIQENDVEADIRDRVEAAGAVMMAVEPEKLSLVLREVIAALLPLAVQAAALITPLGTDTWNSAKLLS